MERIDIQTFLSESIHIPVIDVRSPREYQHGHFPGAHLVPLFTNEERAVVGTTYKTVNRRSAILAGLDIVGPKMTTLTRQAEELAWDKELLLYCWRGGMRSESMAWLLHTAGLHARVLEGGYKHYRQHIRASLSTPFFPLILGGYTGSGKSEILQCLEKRPQQVIDLEKLAHHKGSAFGAIGQDPQPTSEQFENNLFECWRWLDKTKTIWLEDESKSIGTVQVPDELYQPMKKGPVIVIVIPKEQRMERLVRDYTDGDLSLLAASVEKIRKRLGTESTLKALKALDAHDFHTVADITLTYYDKAYNHNLSKRDPSRLHVLDFTDGSPDQQAEKLLAFASSMGILK